MSSGRKRPSILSDAVEATIGAIYEEAGFEVVEKFIINNLQEHIENSISGMGIKDYKTLLQEKLQENGEVHIEYELISESGLEHEKVFTVLLKCDGKKIGTGKGRTKKEAEMMAAKKALE